MEISKDLIRDFVSITENEKQSTNKKVLYGTVEKVEDGVPYVKIDGSDVSTPAVSEAVSKVGDRVTLSIENHTAVINGNLSYTPDGRIGDSNGFDIQYGDDPPIHYEGTRMDLPISMVGYAPLYIDNEQLGISMKTKEGDWVDFMPSHVEWVDKYQYAQAEYTTPYEEVAGQLTRWGRGDILWTVDVPATCFVKSYTSGRVTLNKNATNTISIPITSYEHYVPIMVDVSSTSQYAYAYRHDITTKENVANMVVDVYLRCGDNGSATSITTTVNISVLYMIHINHYGG